VIPTLHLSVLLFVLGLISPSISIAQDPATLECGQLEVLVEPVNVSQCNTSPLNGVNMLDVLKIQRHILGLEILNSPYKMIAANASPSPDPTQIPEAITSSDIVELRKLILGATTVLPVPSWRFVPQSYVFPNPNNPFNSQFPESETITTGTGVTADFYGIKSGDVTGDADGCTTQKPGSLPVAQLSIAVAATHKTGKFFTYPIIYQGSTHLVALQSAFRFDATKYRFLGVGTGETSFVQPSDFNLDKVNEGVVKLAWCVSRPDQEGLQPGEVLFYLTLEEIGKTGNAEKHASVLQIAETEMPNLAFDAQNVGYSLALQIENHIQLRESALASDLTVVATPNPVTESLKLSLEWDKTDKVEVILYDAFGRHAFRKEYALTPGSHTILIDNLSDLPAGAYRWVVRSRKLKSSGHFVKI
jgi:hypothetical protein